MKKIILETNGREFNISSLEELTILKDILEGLVIPCFGAAGFSKSEIASELLNWAKGEIGPSTAHVSCDACSNQATTFLCDRCSEIIPASVKEEIESLKSELDNLSDIKNRYDSLKEQTENVDEIIKHNNDLHKNNEFLQIENKRLTDTFSKIIEILTDNLAEDKSGVDPDLSIVVDPSINLDGWNTPPADDKPSEPEQEDIPEPEQRNTPPQEESNVWSTGDPQAVGLWSVNDLEEDIPKPAQEVEPEQKEEENSEDSENICPYCNSELIKSIQGCPKCDYRVNCGCEDCRRKRETRSDIPVFDLSQEEKEANAKQVVKNFIAVQEIADNNGYDYDNANFKNITCRTIHEFYPDINCKAKGACSVCPVGTNNRDIAASYGFFLCPDCSSIFNEPFPVGCCPQCGVHKAGENKKEFCDDHWDLNYPNFEAGADEN